MFAVTVVLASAALRSSGPNHMQEKVTQWARDASASERQGEKVERKGSEHDNTWTAEERAAEEARQRLKEKEAAELKRNGRQGLPRQPRLPPVARWSTLSTLHTGQGRQSVTEMKEMAAPYILFAVETLRACDEAPSCARLADVVSKAAFIYYHEESSVRFALLSAKSTPELVTSFAITVPGVYVVRASKAEPVPADSLVDLPALVAYVNRLAGTTRAANGDLDSSTNVHPEAAALIRGYMRGTPEERAAIADKIAAMSEPNARLYEVFARKYVNAPRTNKAVMTALRHYENFMSADAELLRSAFVDVGRDPHDSQHQRDSAVRESTVLRDLYDPTLPDE